MLKILKTEKVLLPLLDPNETVLINSIQTPAHIAIFISLNLFPGFLQSFVEQTQTNKNDILPPLSHKNQNHTCTALGLAFFHIMLLS